MSTLLSSLPFAIDDRMFRRSTRADALERQVYEMIYIPISVFLARQVLDGRRQPFTVYQEQPVDVG